MPVFSESDWKETEYPMNFCGMENVNVKKKDFIRCVLSAIVPIIYISCFLTMSYSALSRYSGNPMPRIFGWGQAIVLSGSMEPEIPVGALVIVKEAASYQPGDIITYFDGKNLVTHRLVSLADGIVTTQGDANNAKDYPFNQSNILGRVRAVFPRAGYFIIWMRSPFGLLCLLLIGVLILLIARNVGNQNEKATQSDHKQFAP